MRKSVCSLHHPVRRFFGACMVVENEDEIGSKKFEQKANANNADKIDGGFQNNVEKKNGAKVGNKFVSN